ncbi:hypothetical protein OMP38_07780 [Cohnella ginsengisoli]|uniref:Uncharacterized protein n=1 Tax=Cohnella ginsengisoli TaxID=425004 RepID=A0A9X4KJ80_9BACL|nr:hypothetical protein [Cohnella ginsengisoli]MDG0790770.1 hypothetical protein [Cohnella ginsengisoli]
MHYKDGTYCAVYGKKKAHDMLYRLSYCVNGLSVVPMSTRRKAAASLRDNGGEEREA